MNKEQEERVAKYNNVFKSVNGQWVLNDLIKRFTGHTGMGDGKADGMSLAMVLASQRGESEVINYIQRQIDKGV